jgi:hypothetical protein
MNIRGAFANPGSISPTTFQLAQPSNQIWPAGSTLPGFPKTDPSWSVILLDPSGQQFAVFGDWVQAQNTGLTAQFAMNGATQPTTFQVWEVVDRPSNKVDYQGELVQTLVQDSGGDTTVWCDITINSQLPATSIRVTIGTYLVDVGQSIAAGATVDAHYDNETRTWTINGVICYDDAGS